MVPKGKRIHSKLPTTRQNFRLLYFLNFPATKNRAIGMSQYARQINKVIKTSPQLVSEYGPGPFPVGLLV